MQHLALSADALACESGTALSESVLDDFSKFFDDIPDVVRVELSVFLITLTSDGAVDHGEGFDYERAARSFFRTQTRIGQFGTLINAVAVFDTYFASDPAERFKVACGRQSQAASGNRKSDSLLKHYTHRLNAIDGARAEWMSLRQTTLSTKAISAALTAMAPQPKYRRREKPITITKRGTRHGAVP